MKKFIILFIASIFLIPLAFGAGRTTLQTGGGVEVGTSTTPLRSNPVPHTLDAAGGFSGDRIVATGATTLYGIAVAGSAIGGGCLVYDALDATDPTTLKFEVEVAVAKSSHTWASTAGVSFTTGIYVKNVNDADFSSIEYDQ